MTRSKSSDRDMNDRYYRGVTGGHSDYRGPDGIYGPKFGFGGGGGGGCHIKTVVGRNNWAHC